MEPGIEVRSALNVVPWGKRYRLASRVNFALSARLLRRVARSLPDSVILWLYDPTGAVMTGALGQAFTVYDCVDDYAQQYAPDRRRMALVADADTEAGKVARLVFATTEPLAERHRRTNPRTYLVPNAGDYGHFAQASERTVAAPELHDLRPPVVGFTGNLTSIKVDFSLLAALANERPEWTLVLVGPAREDAQEPLSHLTRLPNVRWFGWKPYDELPRYVAGFDVGLCPYVANAYTRNIFPLKVYEYLAAGKPVVAAGLPSLRGMEPDVTVADGRASFVTAIEASLARSGDQDRARRMALAARNTWDVRTERLLDLISTELRLPVA